MRPDLNLVANLIISQISSVQIQVDKLIRRIKLQSHKLAHCRRYSIANKRLVASIGEQSPAFSLGIPFAEKLLLTVEFQSVWLFAKPPSGITSSANLQGIVTSDRIILVNIPHRSIYIILLTRYRHFIEGLYIYSWKICVALDIYSLSFQTAKRQQHHEKRNKFVFYHKHIFC